MNAQALLKYSLSFFKRDWDLEDYPIESRHWEMGDTVAASTFGSPVTWVINVRNWRLMRGQGATRDEAYANLRFEFDTYKSKGNKLPRPGTSVPMKLEIAPRVEVEGYDRIADDFFARIMQTDYRNVLITDESSLLDFGVDEKETQTRIKEVYGVDVSDIEYGNLVRIFERIDQAGQ